MGLGEARRQEARAFACEHGLEDQVLVPDEQLAASAPSRRAGVDGAEPVVPGLLRNERKPRQRLHRELLVPAYEVAGHVGRQLERKQRYGAELGSGRGAVADGDVVAAVIERPVFVRNVERERDARVVAAKLRQARQQPERRERRRRREREKPRVAQLLECPLDGREAERDAWREAGAGLRELEPRTAHEQRRAQAFLELRDALADCRLGEAELLRGRGEAPAFRAGSEDAQRFPVLAWPGSWHKRSL